MSVKIKAYFVDKVLLYNILPLNENSHNLTDVLVQKSIEQLILRRTLFSNLRNDKIYKTFFIDSFISVFLFQERLTGSSE